MFERERDELSERSALCSWKKRCERLEKNRVARELMAGEVSTPRREEWQGSRAG
jgi:hypothetical protein